MVGRLEVKWRTCSAGLGQFSVERLGCVKGRGLFLARSTEFAQDLFVISASIKSFSSILLYNEILQVFGCFSYDSSLGRSSLCHNTPSTFLSPHSRSSEHANPISIPVHRNSLLRKFAIVLFHVRHVIKRDALINRS